MIPLLRKSVELLRENPILWLPYLIAELSAIGIWRLRGMAQKSIFHWFMTQYSVLGGEVPVAPTDHDALAKAGLTYTPVGLASIFTVVCLFVVAFMVTAKMMDAVGQEQKIQVKEILAGLGLRWGSIFLFSFVCLVTFAVFAGGAAALLVLVLYRAHHLDLRNSPIFTFGMLPILMGCATWLLMPKAIRLLCADRTVLIPSEAKKRGAITAFIAVEAGELLGVILSKAEAPVQLSTQLGWSLLAAFNSIVANAPDVLLFIAIALLATENSEEAASSQGSGIRPILETLMPLHIRETKEPD